MLLHFLQQLLQRQQQEQQEQQHDQLRVRSNLRSCCMLSRLATGWVL